MSAAYVKVTADGAIGTSGTPKVIYGLHIVSGGSAGTVVLRNGTSTADAAVFSCVGVAGEGNYFSFSPGVVFPAGCYYDEDANVSHALVIYREL